ncbi:MAG: hypothetical protein LBP22_06025 [Deltaproteobacteria bacterium]|jgi:hypothetical protein|nr:hypothetical protein [Deltaproteobacteria bacterium]
MKSWLPYLVGELRAGREVVLVQTAMDNVALAGVTDNQGSWLAGNNPDQTDWADLLKDLTAGQPKSLTRDRTFILAELIAPAEIRFWERALHGQHKAWAAWLLTMVDRRESCLKVVRHILAAVGPWNTPRIPPESSDHWFLMPLNAGLGSLLIFGDDDIALETAALGARAGLKVNLVTVGRSEADIKSAQAIGDFTCQSFGDWSEISESNLPKIGLKPGVFVLITTGSNQSFLGPVKEAPTGWLGLAGGAAEGSESGLFPEAVTAAQKAMGLLAEMLEN